MDNLPELPPDIRKVIVEYDFNEIVEDNIGMCSFPRFFEKNGAVYEQWIVRPGKSDSNLVGHLVENEIFPIKFTNDQLTALYTAIEQHIWDNYHIDDDSNPAVQAYTAIQKYFGDYYGPQENVEEIQTTD